MNTRNLESPVAIPEKSTKMKASTETERKTFLDRPETANDRSASARNVRSFPYLHTSFNGNTSGQEYQASILGSNSNIDHSQEQKKWLRKMRNARRSNAKRKARVQELRTLNQKLVSENENLKAQIDAFSTSYPTLGSGLLDVHCNDAEHAQLMSRVDELQEQLDIQEDFNKEIIAHIDEAHQENERLHDEIKEIEMEKKYHQSRDQEYADVPRRICDEYLVPWIRQKKLDCKSTKSTLYQSLSILFQDASNAELLRADLESEKAQVQALQEQLLSNVEKIEVLSDEKFAQDFRILAASIKAFSRSIQLSKTKDILTIRDIMDSRMVQSVDRTYWTTPIRRKGLIEAFIWSVLYESLFDSPCKCGPVLMFHILPKLTYL